MDTIRYKDYSIYIDYSEKHNLWTWDVNVRGNLGAGPARSKSEAEADARAYVDAYTSSGGPELNLFGKSTIPAQTLVSNDSSENRIGLLTGDPYVDDCLLIKFKHIEDARTWNEFPEMMKIAGLVNSNKLQEGLEAAFALKEKHPDFDHIYRWIALAYQKQGERNKAIKALEDGLNNSFRKYHLCNYLAIQFYESNNLGEAFKWWVQSVLIQDVFEDFGDYEPFLYLGYISLGFDMKPLSKRFIIQADRIRSDGLRLIEAAEKKLTKLLSEQATQSIGSVLKIIEDENLQFGK
ncbi:MAG: hypothetical protein DWQ04_29430 [Chloroflexi bacterium]|nr:MAG: hypothetical protein DWQ04_29430 [Chloroflexota bacterium]